jgi:hypothetical protein
VTLDFSQYREFADYSIAVLGNLLLSVPHKRVQLASLRQHQARLFKYFGVDVGEPLHEPPDSTPSVEGPTVA